MSVDYAPLMRRGYLYAGRSAGVEQWQAPDGRRLWLDGALAEIDDPKEKNVTDNRPLNGLTLEAYANQLPTWQARRIARVAGYAARVNGKAATMHRFYEYVIDTAADPEGRKRLLKAAGLAETKEERRARLQRERPPAPTRLVADGAGGFFGEPIRHERLCAASGPTSRRSHPRPSARSSGAASSGGPDAMRSASASATSSANADLSPGSTGCSAHDLGGAAHRPA